MLNSYPFICPLSFTNTAFNDISFLKTNDKPKN